jgi:hypothetical protein
LDEPAVGGTSRATCRRLYLCARMAFTLLFIALLCSVHFGICDGWMLKDFSARMVCCLPSPAQLRPSPDLETQVQELLVQHSTTSPLNGGGISLCQYFGSDPSTKLKLGKLSDEQLLELSDLVWKKERAVSKTGALVMSQDRRGSDATNGRPVSHDPGGGRLGGDEHGDTSKAAPDSKTLGKKPSVGGTTVAMARLSVARVKVTTSLQRLPTLVQPMATDFCHRMTSRVRAVNIKLHLSDIEQEQCSRPMLILPSCKQCDSRALVKNQHPPHLGELAVRVSWDAHTSAQAFTELSFTVSRP